MTKHKSFTVDTNVQVYFCDPQSPWQRGTNENTNRPLRQYFPKKTDLSDFSQADLDRVALRDFYEKVTISMRRSRLSTSIFFFLCWEVFCFLLRLRRMLFSTVFLYALL
jgi:hypothetical protein